MPKLAALLAVLLSFATAPATAAAAHADLHGGVNVGMNAADLPAEGYKDFVCAQPEPQKLNGWADWKTCAPDAEGLRALHVEIDEAGHDETLVAGHPVTLTLAFDDKGRLARIDIVTTDKTRMFMRKKAYLLGLQARARYGEDGWECKEEPLAADEEGLGPTAVKEHCSKAVGDRRVIVDRSLFRKVGADPKSFTSESRVVIVWLGGTN